MSYKKIIPCLDLENALEMAKFYNDAGAAIPPFSSSIR